jgi:hypothetical protein
MAKKIPFPTNAAYEVHSHVFVSGPRHGGHYENNKWHTGEFSHSHPQGSTPHTHPQTGPSSYGYGWARGKSNKLTAKPTGEQMPPIPLTEEENTFELIVTDSALIHGKTAHRRYPARSTRISGGGANHGQPPHEVCCPR